MTDPDGAFRMFRRRLVFIEDWFDDEHELPWNWVQRSGDGRFEAIACHLVNDAMVETSLGVFDSAKAAVVALREYIGAEDALVRLESRRGGSHD